MINSFGIMQGRLLPKYNGRYQAHPVGNWKEEFHLAQTIGIDLIEFILDFNESADNPLMSNKGISEISNMVQKTGVGVRSICADYFMEAPLHSINEKIVKQSKEVLQNLLTNSSALGVTDIVIPCVDQSSLQTAEDSERFVSNLTPLLAVASRYNVNLSLETDLAPQQFLNLLNRFDSDKIKVNYDTGNSASLGYDPLEEFATYGKWISDIHIKDRKLNGGSVVLGEGDTNFTSFFNALSRIKYDGFFVMQVYRDEQGVDIFVKQFEWFKNLIKNEFNSNHTS
jgi:sugar phosphate isomerase/epimerase